MSNIVSYDSYSYARIVFKTAYEKHLQSDTSSTPVPPLTPEFKAVVESNERRDKIVCRVVLYCGV